MPSSILELYSALLRWQTLDFMLQTKTETNTMVYRIKNKYKIEEHILYKKICTFCCFFPCWVGCLKPVFKHEAYI